MKSKRISKFVIGASLLLSIAVAPLTGCSGVFEDDGFVITNIAWRQDSDSGKVNVIITTTREDNPTLTFDIPAATSVDKVNAVINEEGDEMSVTITYTDVNKPATTFTIPIIAGKDGKGIDHVDVDHNEKGEITLRFTYTDESVSPLITIPSGKDGKSIADIKINEEDPDFVTLEIAFDDGTSDSVKFPKPNDGVSIKNVTYDETKSTDSTYVLTVTYTDDYSEDIELPRPTSSLWHHGEDAPDDTLGKDGDFYLDQISGIVYCKEGGTWQFVFSMDGSESTKKHVVTFDAQGGHWINPAIIDGQNYVFSVSHRSNMLLDNFPTVEKDNYVFEGWFTSPDNNPNAGQFTDLTPVLRNLKVYARWTPIMG